MVTTVSKWDFYFIQRALAHWSLVALLLERMVYSNESKWSYFSCKIVINQTLVSAQT